MSLHIQIPGTQKREQIRLQVIANNDDFVPFFQAFIQAISPHFMPCSNIWLDNEGGLRLGKIPCCLI